MEQRIEASGLGDGKLDDELIARHAGDDYARTEGLGRRSGCGRL